jgi:hypothetical protein
MTSPIFTKPTISRVKTMLDTGLTNKEIAAAIGTTEASLAVRISQLGLSRNPHRPLDKPTRVAIPERTITRCAPHAARRDLSPSELIRLLVDRITQDNLFEAVLDDGGEVS